MGDVAATLQALRGRLDAVLAARGSSLALEVSTDEEVEDHLMGPLATVLLVAARYPQWNTPMRVQARNRAGGDVEVIVSGLALPDGFPKGEPEAELWEMAVGFLREFHRARGGFADDRIFFLLPGKSRARSLRMGREEG